MLRTDDAGRWTLDAGRWTPDDGRRTLDAGRWTQDPPHLHTSLCNERAAKGGRIATRTERVFSFRLPLAANRVSGK